MTTQPAADEDTGRSTSLVRLLVGVVVGALVATVVPWSSVVAAVLAAWATVATVFVVWTWAVITPMDADDTASHATREEPTRAGAHLIVLAAAVVALVGVAVVLLDHEVGKLSPTIAVLSSVIASWAALNTVFTLRYARMYLEGGAGGIVFHQDEPPVYTDFAYVALTIGMSFAVSDPDLTNSRMRRTALFHALLSYLFGTVIIAVVVNIVAAL
jgi:uncharacterized membrane protein